MAVPEWQQDFLKRHSLPQSYLPYALKWFTPLAAELAVHRAGAKRPLLVAINGAQGSGKSTACDYLRNELEATFGLQVLSLSLDDFYHTRGDRMGLATSVHPLLATRGVPGTHDMNLLQQTLAALLAGESGRVDIPRFDKALDDRRPRSSRDVFIGPADIILLEGWCLGARGQSAAELARPVNALEAEEDPDGRWRNYVNEALERDFVPLYTRVDQWIMLAAPSFDCVYRWRLEQEQKLAGRSQGHAIMHEVELTRFIQFYERLSRHCLEQLPPLVDYHYQLDEQRQVLSHRHCLWPEA